VRCTPVAHASARENRIAWEFPRNSSEIRAPAALARALLQLAMHTQSAEATLIPVRRADAEPRSPRRAARSPTLASRAPASRDAIVAAATRLLWRDGARALTWSRVAREARTSGPGVHRRFADLRQLVYECHARSAARLDACLMRAETCGGIARDRVAAFLRAAFGARREHGAFLPLSGVAGVDACGAKSLREREAMVRARLDRVLLRGERDGSLAALDRAAAIDLVLAALQSTPVGRPGRDRVERDAAVADLLLRALAGEAASRAY
jgi:AcrR family transcriptional regulator